MPAPRTVSCPPINGVPTAQTPPLTPALPSPCRRRGWRPPAVARTLCTILLQLTLAHYTFWRAAHVFGLTEAALANILSTLGLAERLACV